MPVPTSVYDRGSLFASNLLQGKLDASTVSLFAPMDLSPSEIDQLKRALTANGKRAENPILKTITDLASNPIVWIGMALALGPWGKTANIKHLASLMKEGKSYMREVSPLMRGLLSPFTALRNLWHTGIMDKMLDVVGTTAEFQSRHFESYQSIVRTAQKSLGRHVTKREWRLVDAFLRGWHKPGSPLARQFPTALGDDLVIAPKLLDHMSRPLRKLAGDLRGLLDDIGKEVLIGPNNEVLEDLAQKGVEFVQEGYAPRQTMRRALTALLGEGADKSVSTYRRMVRKMGPLGGRAKATHARQSFSIPLAADLDLIQDVIDPKAMRTFSHLEQSVIKYMRNHLQTAASRLQGMTAAGAGEADMLEVVKGLADTLKTLGHPESLAAQIVAQLRHRAEVNPASIGPFIESLVTRMGPARFPLDPVQYMPKYIRTMGPTYAWISKGLGRHLDDIFSKGSKYAHVVKGWQRDMYEQNLRPSLKGLLTPKEMARRLWFDDASIKAREWLSGDSPAARLIPAKTREWLSKGLEAGLFSEGTLGGRLASLLYVSSLGANASPVSKNLFQNFITTMNYVGPRNMGHGLKTVAGRLSSLADDMAKGVPFEKAFQSRFKEYYEQFGYEHMLKAMTAGDIAKEASAVGSAVKGAWGKVSSTMMAPFAASEKLNRLWAFYSTYGAGKAAGLAEAAAGNIARNLTLLTQFGGGAVGIPQAIRNLPVPARQFAHFPLRYLEWLYGSMAFHPDPAKKSFGVIGRTLASSAGVYTIFKNLVGLDTSKALAFGAMPVPDYPESPFFPWPLVPPAIGIGGDILKSAVTGEWEGTGGRVGAMLVPGGLAARRAWKSWHPKYVDYNNPTTDGRLPIYNKEGYLIKYESPMQVVLRGLGLKTTDAAQEQAVVKWLLAQRDKLREYRRLYTEAVADGKMDRAKAVQAEFARKYPQLGPIQFKKSDLTAIRNRKELTRIQRILKGFPAEYRPIFQEAASLGTLGHMSRSLSTTGTPGFAF